MTASRVRMTVVAPKPAVMASSTPSVAIPGKVLLNRKMMKAAAMEKLPLTTA